MLKLANPSNHPLTIDTSRITEKQIYRIVWVGRDPKGPLPLAPFNQAFNTFQGWDTRTFAEQLVSVLHHHLSKEFLPNI